MAKLDTTTAILSDVQYALGTFPNTVSGVCSYHGINPWSKAKPFRNSAKGYKTHSLLMDALRAADYGLLWDGGIGKDSFNVDFPTGGESAPYRLGDFRGYDHSQDHGMGVYSLTPATVNLDNIAGSNSVRIYGGNNSDYIGYWDIRNLLYDAGYRYLMLRLTMPRSTLVGQTVIDVQTIDLLAYASVPSFALSNRTICKLGRTDDGAGVLTAILVSNGGGTQIIFDWQHKGTYIANIVVANVETNSWGWNDDAASVGYRDGGADLLELFEYWQEVPMGSPRYLDLSDKEYLLVDTNTAVNGADSVTLDYNNVRLRITNWTTGKEWYCQTYGDENRTSYYWSLPSDTATGLKLKVAANALPDFGTGIFGFSLVYSPDATVSHSSNFLPLTKECFARVKFPATGNTPFDIF